MGLRIFGFREFAKTLPGAASAWVWRRPEASLFAENHAVCWDPSAERQGQGGSPGSRNCRGPPAGAGVPRVTPCALAICKLCRQGRGGRIDPLRQPGRKPRRGQQRGLVPYGPHRPPRPLGSPRPCRPIGAPKTARIACWTRRCRRIGAAVAKAVHAETKFCRAIWPAVPASSKPQRGPIKGRVEHTAGTSRGGSWLLSKPPPSQSRSPCRNGYAAFCLLGRCCDGGKRS